MFLEEQFTNNINNIRATWKLINTTIGRPIKNSGGLPSVFSYNNKTYNNPSDIADGFNDFFVEIGQTLSKKIPPSETNFRDYLGMKCLDIFKFRTVTVKKVLDTASKMKPKVSCGFDLISNNFF